MCGLPAFRLLHNHSPDLFVVLCSEDAGCVKTEDLGVGDVFPLRFNEPDHAVTHLAQLHLAFPQVAGVGFAENVRAIGDKEFKGFHAASVVRQAEWVQVALHAVAVLAQRIGFGGLEVNHLFSLDVVHVAVQAHHAKVGLDLRCGELLCQRTGQAVVEFHHDLGLEFVAFPDDGLGRTGSSFAGEHTINQVVEGRALAHAVECIGVEFGDAVDFVQQALPCTFGLAALVVLEGIQQGWVEIIPRLLHLRTFWF